MANKLINNSNFGTGDYFLQLHTIVVPDKLQNAGGRDSKIAVSLDINFTIKKIQSNKKTN